MTLFTGLSAFPLTPAEDEGQLKPELLQRFLERIVAAGVDSIGLLGSTGGYAYLTPEERKRTLRAAVECVAGRTPLITGLPMTPRSLSTQRSRGRDKEPQTARASWLRSDEEWVGP